MSRGNDDLRTIQQEEFYSAPWSEGPIRKHPGIYHAIFDEEVVYIGMARDLAERISDHEASPWFFLLKHLGFTIQWRILEFDRAMPRSALSLIEKKWIRVVHPALNRASTTSIYGDRRIFFNCKQLKKQREARRNAALANDARL